MSATHTSPGGAPAPIQAPAQAPVQAPVNQTAMTPRVMLGLGIFNIVGGVVAFVALAASYGFSEQVVVTQRAAGTDVLSWQTVHWWGPDFALTVTVSFMIVGALAGIVGSFIQQSKVFAERSGRRTLEQGYLWWYLSRPVWSGLLGGVVVLAVSSGLIGLGGKVTSTAGLSVLVTMGVIAGLFTDKVLQRFRDVLGATDPQQLGSVVPTPAVT